MTQEETAVIAQVALYFARKNGEMPEQNKLVALVYLANRQSMARHTFPIISGPIVATPFGPANQKLIDCLDQKSPHQDVWNTMHLKNPTELTPDDFDLLGQTDRDVLDRVWNTFHTMNAEHISLAMKDVCPEWNDPSPSYKKIFASLGFQNAHQLSIEIESFEEIDRLFSNLA